jgi:hypothetical protein
MISPAVLMAPLATGKGFRVDGSRTTMEILSDESNQ